MKNELIDLLECDNFFDALKIDDTKIRGILNQTVMAKAVLVAHELGLFELLAKEPQNFESVCEKLKLTERPGSALIKACISLDLVNKEGVYFMLSEVSKLFLTPSSPAFIGPLLDLMIVTDEVRTYSKVKTAFLTDKPQIYNHGDLFKEHDTSDKKAKLFTDAMHCKSIIPASLWPKSIDLSKHTRLLDIGGGSGVHTVAACKVWSHLSGTVFESPVVSKITKGYIKHSVFESSIDIFSGNMWEDTFPSADIHFYSDIYHDWPIDKCIWLTQKSFQHLPPGGILIIHEMVYDTEETIPYSVAAYNLGMLLWTQGQQFAAQTLVNVIRDAGFIDVGIKKVFGHWNIAFGYKPAS